MKIKENNERSPLLQPIINIKARIFKEISTRNDQNCVILKESQVSYRKLTQLTLFCKQQGIPTELFGPACYLFIDYWPRFFPYFDLHEAYYEYSEAGDFALTICYYKKPNRLRGQTRNLREKSPNLFAVCLREVELKKVARKDQELSNRQDQIVKLEEKYKFLKKSSKEDIKEKKHHLNVVLSKYEEVELEKQVLAQETTYKAQTIETLQEVLKELETELNTVKTELKEEQQANQIALKSLQQVKAADISSLVTERLDLETVSTAITPSWESQTRVKRTKEPLTETKELISKSEAFIKETDPTEKLAYQREFERQIRERFREAQRPAGNSKVRIAEADLAELKYQLKNLKSSWDELPMIDLTELEVIFFEWCQLYIDQLDEFKEELTARIKREVLRKGSYLTTKAMLHKLQGYSLLCIYIDEIIHLQGSRQLDLLIGRD